MKLLINKARQFVTWLQMAAMCLILSATGTALAQYRVETYDGHLLDASNRVGGGGYNINNAINPNAINAEYIYLGDVTGYGGFKGNVPDRDPRGFTGYIPPQPSLALQQAVGTSSPTANPNYTPTPYFNQYTAPSSAVPLQQIPGTSSYTVAPPPTLAAQDYRLGSTLNVPTSSLPKAGETVGPGAVDPTADMTPSFLSGSPVGGANAQIQPIAVQSYAQPGTTGLGTNGQPVSPLVAGLSQRDLVRLRGELSQETLTPAAQSQLQSGAISNLVGATPPGTGAGAPTTPGAAIPSTPISGQLTQPQVDNSLVAAQPMQNSQISPGANNYSTGQQERTNLPLPPPPSEQSPQYAKLRLLLDQYNNSHPVNDEAANRQFQAALEARRQYEQSLIHPAPTSGKPSDNGQQAPTATLGAKSNEAEPPAAPPPALQVGPIGADIRASGLSQLVQQAEESARHQHFKDAISKFLDARQVAPNNQLITVDLANAQLGAGFYAEAEQSLRTAYAADAATQMGKYDLKSEIGDERLQVLIADLKQLATTGDSVTPVFLLAYLSYNEGDTDKAVEYLHLAQTRAGGQDDLIRSLGEHWTLPSTRPGK